MDLDESLGMELVVTDKSGTVTCVEAITGKRKWTAKVGGNNFPGSSLADVNLDGQLDVVVATSEGYASSY